jgi:hypothetical protein
MFIPPLSTDYLERVRLQGTDALGQPVKRVRAAGGEPCRDVLRRARPGEELLLASFSPFTQAGPYKEYGPVFLLADASDEPVTRDVLPVNGAEAYLREQFVIRAYSHAEEILDASMVTRATAAATVANFLARDAVAFLHLRFPTYGCFACRIDRD